MQHICCTHATTRDTYVQDKRVMRTKLYGYHTHTHVVCTRVCCTPSTHITLVYEQTAYKPHTCTCTHANCTPSTHNLVCIRANCIQATHVYLHACYLHAFHTHLVCIRTNCIQATHVYLHACQLHTFHTHSITSSCNKSLLSFLCKFLV